MTYIAPNVRKEQLLEAALVLAREHGYTNVTRQMIAKHCKISEALVSLRLGTMDNMRRSLMRRAVATRDLSVIAQGVCAKDRYALKASPELRAKAVASLA